LKTKSGVKFATANPSFGGPPHSKARWAREALAISPIRRFGSCLSVLSALSVVACRLECAVL